MADDMPEVWVQIELGDQIESSDEEASDKEEEEEEEGCLEADMAARANKDVLDSLQEQGRKATAQEEFRRAMPRRSCRKD